MYPHTGLESTSPSEVNTVTPWTLLSFKLKFNLTITMKGQEELVVVIAERCLQPSGSWGRGERWNIIPKSPVRSRCRPKQHWFVAWVCRFSLHWQSLAVWIQPVGVEEPQAAAVTNIKWIYSRMLTLFMRYFVNISVNSHRGFAVHPWFSAGVCTQSGLLLSKRWADKLSRTSVQCTYAMQACCKEIFHDEFLYKLANFSIASVMHDIIFFLQELILYINAEMCRLTDLYSYLYSFALQSQSGDDIAGARPWFVCSC